MKSEQSSTSNAYSVGHGRHCGGAAPCHQPSNDFKEARRMEGIDGKHQVALEERPPTSDWLDTFHSGGAAPEHPSGKHYIVCCGGAMPLEENGRKHHVDDSDPTREEAAKERLKEKRLYRKFPSRSNPGFENRKAGKDRTFCRRSKEI